MRFLLNAWQRPYIFWYALLPLAWLYQGLVRLRRDYYQRLSRPVSSNVPVVVVGNICLGGAGKTPCLLALIPILQAEGLSVGVISRGYKAQTMHYPVLVDSASNPADVGDEPYLIAKKTGVPVVIDPKRVRALHALLSQHACDVVLSDDGLQHYALPRDIDIAMLPKNQHKRNTLCLPAGPNREPLSRLDAMDYIITRDSEAMYALTLVPQQLISVSDEHNTLALNAFSGKTVHAVTGIGAPAQFFDVLRAQGMILQEHIFPDHHAFRPKDLSFNASSPIIMTEKDAVKCRDFATENMWYVSVNPVLSPQFVADFIDHIQRVLTQKKRRRAHE